MPFPKKSIPAAPRKNLPRVAMLFHTNEEAHRDILRGVLRYVRLHGPWSLRIAEERSGEQGLDSFRAWGGSGMLGVSQDAASAELIRHANVPIVLIDPDESIVLPHAFLARQVVLVSDQLGIGEMAAQHFLERGFAHFAYVETRKPIWWARARGRFFAAALKRAGFGCDFFRPDDSRKDAEADRLALGAWLRSLPKPVAVFAAMDVRGRQVLDVCLTENLVVPDDVAVLGVDNDALICESTFPPLSSIVQDTERMGYEAAASLDERMGKKCRGRGIRRLFPPCGIVTRASTGNLLLPDDALRRAVEYLWLNMDSPDLDVEAMARHVGLSAG